MCMLIVERGINLSNSLGQYLANGSRLECMGGRGAQISSKEKTNKFII